MDEANSVEVLHSLELPTSKSIIYLQVTYKLDSHSVDLGYCQGFCLREEGQRATEEVGDKQLLMSNIIKGQITRAGESVQSWITYEAFLICLCYDLSFQLSHVLPFNLQLMSLLRQPLQF